MGRISTTVQFDRLDKDFHLLESRKQASRSWTKHFFDLWYIQLGWNSNTLAGILDIAAAARALPVRAEGSCALMTSSPGGGALAATLVYRIGPGGAGGVLSYDSPWQGQLIGITVGTNNTAVTPTDNSLFARVEHGIGAGQLEYGGSEVLAPTFANPNGSMILRRYLTNNSGGDIVIQEAGIYSPIYSTGGIAYIFCICRDVVAPAVTVATTEILVVTYTMQITV